MATNSRISQPRTKRSTNGCITCVQSKVKCDENKPCCQRCNRLDKDCKWPGPRIPLKTRRRGFGPLKSRENVSPQPIQPSTTSRVDNNVSYEIDGFPSIATIMRERSGDLNNSDLSPSALNAISISTPLTTTHILSGSSVSYGPIEQDALYFYENVFSRLTPKSFLWSVMAIVLKYGCETKTIMHLLLATCLSEMSLSCVRQSFLPAAKSHFKSGTQSLILDMGVESPDHCRSLITFWLLQLTFRATWNRNSQLSMKRLSTSIAEYVRKHRLLDLLGDQDISLEDYTTVTAPSSPSRSISPSEKTLIAKMLLLTAYEDLDSCLCNGGGDLSALVLAGGSLSDAVFTQSQAAQARFFGADYPTDELMDDIERSKPLELHFHANIALSCFSQVLRQKGSISKQFEQLGHIENRLRGIKEQYWLVFQLAETPVLASKKLTITTYSVVAHYYAVLVSVLRATAALSGDVASIERASIAQKGLLHAVRHVIAHCESSSPLWRDQWPIFVAAAESEDMIHADWLLMKLGNNRYSMLQKKISLQKGR